MKWPILGVTGLIAVAATIIVVTAGDADPGQRADISGQGGSEPALAVDGARLVRDTDGVRVQVSVPTPAPGSYEYPSSDMVPDWSSSTQPEVVVGGPDEPEVFTMWLIVFNYPDRCTDDACGLDDFAVDASAKGGIYQADGRIADRDVMELTGSARLGQRPVTGSALENPLGAEVHLAIAPHGKALAGAEGWRQLNGPIGNPSLWWGVNFSA